MSGFPQEGCKLFVYGVGPNLQREEIQEEFERFGEVTDTYNSGKGYAFVTFRSASEAAQAREAMNGQTIAGQEIKVDVARPRVPGGEGRGHRGGGGGGRGGFRDTYRGDFSRDSYRGGGRQGGRGGYSSREEGYSPRARGNGGLVGGPVRRGGGYSQTRGGGGYNQGWETGQ